MGSPCTPEDREKVIQVLKAEKAYPLDLEQIIGRIKEKYGKPANPGPCLRELEAQGKVRRVPPEGEHPARYEWSGPEESVHDGSLFQPVRGGQ